MGRHHASKEQHREKVSLPAGGLPTEAAHSQ